MATGETVDGWALTLLNTRVSPTAAMTQRLDTQEPPAGCSVDRECALKAADAHGEGVRVDSMPRFVRFERHPNSYRVEVLPLSLLHIRRCRRIEMCKSRWYQYHDKITQDRTTTVEHIHAANQTQIQISILKYIYILSIG